MEVMVSFSFSKNLVCGRQGERRRASPFDHKRPGTEARPGRWESQPFGMYSILIYIQDSSRTTAFSTVRSLLAGFFPS